LFLLLDAWLDMKKLWQCIRIRFHNRKIIKMYVLPHVQYKFENTLVAVLETVKDWTSIKNQYEYNQYIRVRFQST
jgi:hypothetical protein